MGISIYVDGTNPSKSGDMPVKLCVTCRSGRFYIPTGLRTKTKFEGIAFPSTEMSHEAKTACLCRIFSQAHDIFYDNMGASDIELRRIILRDVFGKSFREPEPEDTDYLADRCDEYARTMKKTTAAVYTCASKRIREYDDKVTLEKLTPEWLRGFESYLFEEGLTINGVAQKMRCIKRIMNWCHGRGLTDNYPFGVNGGYVIREERTEPNALTPEQFALLRDYPCQPWQEIYRDIFCLSAYLGGVNFGDLLLCKGLTGGRFVFVRRKTDKVNARHVDRIDLPVSPEAMAIINRYKGRRYLLNIMERVRDYATFTQHCDKALKKIGPQHREKDKWGAMRKIVYEPLFPALTTMSARYTFASVAANELDIPDRTIGMCFGHAWTKEVTSRYISRDQRKIDDAVLRVSAYLGNLKV